MCRGFSDILTALMRCLRVVLFAGFLFSSCAHLRPSSQDLQLMATTHQLLSYAIPNGDRVSVRVQNGTVYLADAHDAEKLVVLRAVFGIRGVRVIVMDGVKYTRKQLLLETVFGAAVGAIGGIGKLAPPIPSVSLWPPPQPSAIYEIPRAVNMPESLAPTIDAVQQTVRQAGYPISTWFPVPTGAAIITPLEQTDAEGYPRAGESRWSSEVPPLRSTDLHSYAKALLTARVGYYRVLVIVITSYPLQTGARLSAAEMNALAPWLARQVLSLNPMNSGCPRPTGCGY